MKDRKEENIGNTKNRRKCKINNKYTCKVRDTTAPMKLEHIAIKKEIRHTPKAQETKGKNR